MVDLGDGLCKEFLALGLVLFGFHDDLLKLFYFFIVDSKLSGLIKEILQLSQAGMLGKVLNLCQDIFDLFTVLFC